MYIKFDMLLSIYVYICFALGEENVYAEMGNHAYEGNTKVVLKTMFFSFVRHVKAIQAVISVFCLCSFVRTDDVETIFYTRDVEIYFRCFFPLKNLVS